MAYSSITKPTDYFNTVTYTGDGSSSNAITGVGFQADWIWIKNRSSAQDYALFDSVRGQSGGVYYKIRSNTTNAEDADSQGLSTIGSDGFTVKDNDQVNKNSDGFVSWNWLAGGSASSNSDGSITSSVSVNTTAGFSIVSYTGTGSNATVGHGLGVAPLMIFIKARSATESWTVYHKDLTSAAYNLTLNDATAEANNASHFNSTAPTSSVFSIGTSGRVSVSSQTQIAYCFAEKKGYSKFGSYTGNGNANGTFVYTGFKPAWILSKRTDNSSGGEWNLLDNKRDTFNVADAKLEANNSDAEETDVMYDILSNGFKIRAGDGNINASGGTYIYMAFAENPFVGNDSGTAVPVVAR